MRYLFAAAVTMALAGPAYSQVSMGPEKDPLKLKYEAEDKARAENERAYNETMKRLKKQAPATTNTDPWKTVRPASESNAKR
jgi:hypothetical protein